MGQVLEFELSVKSCIKFAHSAFKKQDYLLSLQNLNEAMGLAFNSKDIHNVLEGYSKVFREIENNKSFATVLAQSVFNKNYSGYYRMDYSEFLTYNDSYVENEQLRQMSLSQMAKYNQIKSMFAERQYDDAIASLSNIVLNSEIAIGVVDCLKTAVANDDKFRLDNYIVTLLEVLAHSQSYYDMIKLMLEGGRLTHDIMVDNVDYFLSEADSVASLVILGETFFCSNEVDLSQKFFEEALRQNPIEESSLYYMTVINLLLNKKEEAIRYWDIFKVAYEITAPPIALYQRFFDSTQLSFLVPYGVLPFEFSQELLTEYKYNGTKEDFTEQYAKDYLEFCMLCNERHVLETINFKKLNSKPLALRTYLAMLKNIKISLSVKKKIMMLLCENGYEGRIELITDSDIVVFDLARLHHRVNQWWAVVYNAVARNLPFSDFYMPIQCSLLGSTVKKLNTLVPNLEMEDLNFAIAMVVFNYIKRLKINVDIYEVAKSMNLELTDIAKGLTKYDLKELFI